MDRIPVEMKITAGYYPLHFGYHGNSSRQHVQNQQSYVEDKKEQYMKYLCTMAISSSYRHSCNALYSISNVNACYVRYC